MLLFRQLVNRQSLVLFRNFRNSSKWAISLFMTVLLWKFVNRQKICGNFVKSTGLAIKLVYITNQIKNPEHNDSNHMSLKSACQRRGYSFVVSHSNMTIDHAFRGGATFPLLIPTTFSFLKATGHANARALTCSVWLQSFHHLPQKEGRSNSIPTQ